MCVCVLFKIFLQQLFMHWPSPHDHPPRPLLDAIRLNRCRRKPSANSQNVSISLILLYYLPRHSILLMF